MPRYFVRETFFRPEQAHTRETTTLPAAIHNQLQLLLTRGGDACFFVPIRSMQYLAVVDRDEVIFVDGQGGYAYQDGEGGRLIHIAWRPAAGRVSLSAPVSYEILYYFGGLKGLQTRLLAEIGPALKQMVERQRGPAIPARVRRVLPFKRPGSDVSG